MWKVIEDAPTYQVSEEGEVRNCTKKIMKQQQSPLGYWHVGLTHNGKMTRYYTHRLVAIAYLGRSDKQINHKDGNKSNNNLYNLERKVQLVHYVY